MLSSVIAPSSRASSRRIEEQRQRPALLARAPAPSRPGCGRPCGVKWSADQLGSQSRRKASPCAAQLRPGRRGRPSPAGAGSAAAVSIAGGAARRKLSTPQAASRPARLARDRAPRAPARAAPAPGRRASTSPSPKARSRSGVTASILASVSSMLGHPVPDRSASAPAARPAPTGSRAPSAAPAFICARARSISAGGQALGGAAQLVHGQLARARGSGRRRCRRRA